MLTGPFYFRLNCVGTFGRSQAVLIITIDAQGNSNWETQPLTTELFSNDTQITFCATPPSCELISNNMPNTPEQLGGTNGEVTDAVCDALDTLQPQPANALPSVRDEVFLAALRNELYERLSPAQTIPERTRRRLRLHPALAGRFDGSARFDPLDEIMAYPEFPQPMYEPLREVSQELILPGVEKIPQNTVGLLETNGRFLESYMIGLNHEFAGELLWRRYPTDQRGSFFRQFWDVSEYVMPADDVNNLLEQWLATNQLTSMEDFDREKLSLIIRGDLATAAVAATDPGIEVRLAMGDVIVLEDLEHATLARLAEAVVVNEALAEQLKDIAPIHHWGGTALGDNDNRQQNEMAESLVLVVRGDLLKRYPNALIYAIQGRIVSGGNGQPEELMPQLAEYGEPVGPPIFPFFRGSLGADLVFLGFPFEEEHARSLKDGAGAYTAAGKFFVLEERISEARFGLDISEAEADIQQTNQDITIALKDKHQLNWGHFGLSDDFGKYLDQQDATTISFQQSGDTWNQHADAAARARITQQRPARLIIHADQMLPPPLPPES